MKHIVAASAALLALWSRAAALPPIETYGELPDVSDVAISPDGTHFGLIVRERGESLFIVRKLSGEILGGAKAGDIKARQISFPTENFAILRGSQTATPGGWGVKWEQSAAFSFEIATGKLRLLLKDAPFLDRAQIGLGRVAGRLKGTDTLFLPAWTYQGSSYPKHSLIEVDAGGTTGRIHEKGMLDTVDWIVDENGVVLARIDADKETNIFRVQTKKNGGWETIYEEKRTNFAFLVEGVLPDKSNLAVLTEYDDADAQTISLLSFSGELNRAPFVDPQKPVEVALVDAARTVFGVEYAGLVPTYDFIDQALDGDVNALLDSYPDNALLLRDITADRKKLVFHISGGATPPGYILYDRDANVVTRIASDYASLKAEDIAPVVNIVYSARDGLKIAALLTQPPGTRLGEKLPLIVFPHGGPHSHDRLGFDWIAQYFASRGYLVFQPNFRGSDGFGKSFREAGYREWGGKMQDDLTDGVNLLVKKGWADASRICIVGASYGGYAALAGGAFTPDLYKCVAAIAPISDLVTFLDDCRSTSNDWSEDWISERIGDCSKGRDLLKSRSPANAAENFKAPVLLIHGNDDTVVPFNHSLKMEAALKKAGKAVRLVKLKNEDHYLSFSETRLQTLKELDNFVAGAIGGK